MSYFKGSDYTYYISHNVCITLVLSTLSCFSNYIKSLHAKLQPASLPFEWTVKVTIQNEKWEKSFRETKFRSIKSNTGDGLPLTEVILAGICIDYTNITHNHYIPWDPPPTANSTVLATRRPLTIPSLSVFVGAPSSTIFSHWISPKITFPLDPPLFISSTIFVNWEYVN